MKLSTFIPLSPEQLPQNGYGFIGVYTNLLKKKNSRDRYFNGKYYPKDCFIEVRKQIFNSIKFK